jgi:hypothetical protein
MREQALRGSHDVKQYAPIGVARRVPAEKCYEKAATSW